LFRIKICGVTSAKDAQFVALAGADAVGLNFHRQSQRYIDMPTAQAITQVLPPKVLRVGVFVNSAPAEMMEVVQALNLTWVQLHGDEPPELAAAVDGVSLLKAFPFDDGLVARVGEYVDGCQRLGVRLGGLLIDAPRRGEFGGTGEVIDWKELAAMRASLPDLPLVLAGGLTPFNVADAIAAVHPAAVDVASGVESKPGAKDLLLVRAFVTAAKKALAG
jgi:phosphoribosylanthranilate isomerase